MVVPTKPSKRETHDVEYHRQENQTQNRPAESG